MTKPRAVLDPYARRRAAGIVSREETRRRLLTAADELFRERGYPGTTVGAISERAGVSLQTLYLAWGSKRELLRAATAAAAVASEMPMDPEEWRATIRRELADARGGDQSAHAYFAAISQLYVRVAERTAPYWRMVRQAASSDAEIAAFWATITSDSRETFREVARSAPEQGRRAGVAADEITEALWALASPEMYDHFVIDAGHKPGVYRDWLTSTLTATLYAHESG